MQAPFFDFSQLPLDEKGYFTPHFQKQLLELARYVPIRGEGSPEGVVSALQYSLYIDESAAAGSTHYWKKEASLSGDTSKGWQLI